MPCHRQQQRMFGFRKSTCNAEWMVSLPSLLQRLEVYGKHDKNVETKLPGTVQLDIVSGSNHPRSDIVSSYRHFPAPTTRP